MADTRTPELDLIGSSEAAAIVGVHVATIARWAADGTLPIAARLAGKTNPLLFHRADVQRVVDGRAEAGHASVRFLTRILFLLALFLVATVTAWNSPAGTPVAVLLMVGAYYILGRLLFSGALAAPRRARGGAR